LLVFFHDKILDYFKPKVTKLKSKNQQAMQLKNRHTAVILINLYEMHVQYLMRGVYKCYMTEIKYNQTSTEID